MQRIRLLSVTLFLYYSALLFCGEELVGVGVGVVYKVYNRFDFPPDFIFGSGTSSYQAEGAAFEDGRKASIFDTFAHSGRFEDADGDVAADQYHKYKMVEVLLIPRVLSITTTSSMSSSTMEYSHMLHCCTWIHHKLLRMNMEGSLIKELLKTLQHMLMFASENLVTELYTGLLSMSQIYSSWVGMIMEIHPLVDVLFPSEVFVFTETRQPSHILLLIMCCLLMHQPLDSTDRSIRLDKMVSWGSVCICIILFQQQIHPKMMWQLVEFMISSLACSWIL